MPKSGSNHISRVELKLFKLGVAHQSLLMWNMGFRKGQYLALSYLPCASLHLQMSSAIMVWISTFMLTIRNFISHLSQVIQCLDRPPCHRLRPVKSKWWQDSSMGPPRNHGVLFDSTRCLNDHINTICQNINYQLYSIAKIRKYLNKPTTEKMINFVLTFRLDNCSSLLYGINGYLVSQLQLCQNNAARIVSLRRKYGHITPVLKELHWLPVEQGISYKILLLAYKAPHDIAPSYLSSLLSPYKLGRPLRSEGKHLLTTPRYRIEGFGKRCLAHATPSLWNMLPISIKSIDTFKSSLNTHLFNIAYS